MLPKRYIICIVSLNLLFTRFTRFISEYACDKLFHGMIIATIAEIKKINVGFYNNE